jgi:hypothetical protein
VHCTMVVITFRTFVGSWCQASRMPFNSESIDWLVDKASDKQFVHAVLSLLNSAVMPGSPWVAELLLIGAWLRSFNVSLRRWLRWTVFLPSAPARAVLARPATFRKSSGNLPADSCVPFCVPAGVFDPRQT